jgi:6-pyruvoyltetrahydropterin/6-carboxytetrahydropterin synthase
MVGFIPMRLTTLHLAKQNFKFSSGHFLIFDELNAEKLHGHNYRVQVHIGVPDSVDLNKTGYFVDFSEFKKEIKAQLDLWDEHVLLPSEHQDMQIEKKNANYEIHFRDRFYSFPQNEVVLLPVTNTSVEQLSKILAEVFFQKFKKFKVQKITVRVEETPGQSASTTIQKSI